MTTPPERITISPEASRRCLEILQRRVTAGPLAKHPGGPGSPVSRKPARGSPVSHRRRE